jgi:tetratricopeptide (TPR) repeat protein
MRASAPARAGRAGALLLFAAVCAVYAPWLGNGFLYDDREVILEQPTPRSVGDVARYFAEPHGLPHSRLPYYRPVVRATLLVQKALHGDRPALFRAVNVAIAGAAALACLAILRAPRLALDPGPAALAAALFATHPIASATVYPIDSGRETSLPSLLMLAAVAAFLRPGPRWRAASFAAAVAAFFSKEHAVVLLALFVWADLVGASADPPGRDPRRWLARHAPFALAAALWLAVRSAVVDLPPAAHLGSALVADPLGPLRALGFALQSAFAPFPEVVYEPEFVEWFRPARCAAAAVAGVLVAVAAWRPASAARRRWLFFAGWFAIFWLPTANLLPQEAAFAERYVYLAWMALPALAACALTALARRSRARRAGTAGLAAALLLAAATSLRLGAFYLDDLTFYRQWVKTSPGRANARMSLGTSLAREGHIAAALAELREAVRLDPRHAAAQLNLGVLLATQGRAAEAASHFEAALRVAPDDAQAHLYLAAVLEPLGRRDEARRHYAEAARLAPELGDAREGLARLGAAP